MASSKNKFQVSINTDTTPVLYTENIYISTTEDGLVLDVLQKIAATDPVQFKVVSRIGMSRIHAKKFLRELGNLLAITEGQSQTGGKKKN